MDKEMVAELIKNEFKFLTAPTENEVSEILTRLSDSTTEEEFRSIVISIVKDTTSLGFESLDMSASKSILLQILQNKKTSEQSVK